LTRRDS